LVSRQQNAGCGRNIGLPHQAFADQETRDADIRKPREVCGRKDAALTHNQPVFWD
jgi:hypothetical protein